MPRSTSSFARVSLVLASLLVAVLATTAATATTATERRRAEAFRHTRLVRSIPGADSVLTASPATVQLWFSEKIELGLSRVRIEGDRKSVV